MIIIILSIFSGLLLLLAQCSGTEPSWTLIWVCWGGWFIYSILLTISDKIEWYDGGDDDIEF